MAKNNELANLASDILRRAATEIKAEQVVGSIDWTKLFNILIELLPVLVALFTSDNEE
jgi:hypothetical protein